MTTEMKVKAIFEKSRRRAFSLVEVTLALGLTSFALVAVLGLMPAGFTTMREAVDRTVESQITREIRSRVQQMPFEELAAIFDGREFFFAESGAETTKDASDRRYTVKTSVRAPHYPGSEEANPDSLSSVTIEIVSGEGGSQKAHRQHLLVANHGGY